MGKETSDGGDTVFDRTPGDTLNYREALLGSDGIIEIFEDNGGDLPIADVHGPKGECGARFTREEALENAERFVRCVNAHDPLVAAVKDLLGSGPDLVERDCGGHVGANGFECRHCGEVYSDEDAADIDCMCQSDDCPGFRARAALEKAKERYGH